MTMSKDQAILILQTINGQYHRLAGDCNRKLRVEIMRAITGEKTPTAKCGIHAIESAYKNATA